MVKWVPNCIKHRFTNYQHNIVREYYSKCGFLENLENA
jgi:hypothetical protein